MRRTDITGATPALAVGVVLLLDVLHVWLPSIITIFGQAAATPALLLGAFGLAWLVGGFAAPALSRWLGARWVGLTGAVILGATRAALLFVDGGQAQLYVASAGVLSGIAWLAAAADGGARVSPGVPLGITAGSIQHALLGMVDLSWRASWWAWLLGLAEVAALLWLARAPFSRTPAGGWFVTGPVLFLAGMIAVSPAINSTALSYLGLTDRPFLYIPVSIAVALLFLGFAAAAPDRLRIAAALGLVASTAIFAFLSGSWLWAAVLLGAPSLGICTGLAAGRVKHRGSALVGGMVLFGTAAMVYYAAYDLGIPNQWVPIAVGVAVALYAWRAPSATEKPAVVRPAVALTTAAVLAALTGLAALGPATPERPPLEQARLRLVAYNIRMGFGLDGRFDPGELRRVIAAERPDVVLLSEVDRGWLLNGGHDDLAVLARRLGMRAYFGPAADSLWGDAVLTRLPVRTVRSVALPAAGAPTGAQALGVTLPVGGREWTVVSTHLQPPPDGPPDAQARAVVDFARTFGGGPTIVAGDLNIQPQSATMAIFRDAGLTDGLEPFRPVPTSPANRPSSQIDHVLVSGGPRVSELHTARTTASDHLPVAVTLLG